MTEDEERSLIASYQATGDRSVADRLVRAYEPLVHAVAYPVWQRFRSVGLADLEQACRIGVVIAAQRFDPNRGVKFTSWAPWWMRHEMRDVILASRTVYLPSWIDEALRLGTKHGVDTSSAEALAAAGLISQDSGVLRDGALVGHAVSLDVSPTAKDGSQMSGTRADRMPSATPSPEEMVIAAQSASTAKADVEALMTKLLPNERAVIERFVLNEDHDGAKALADEIGVSRQWIFDLRNRAVGKMKARARFLALLSGRRAM